MSHFNRSIGTAALCVALASVAACGSSTGSDAAQTPTPGLNTVDTTLEAPASEAASDAAEPPAAEPAQQDPAPVETQPPAPNATEPPAPTETQPPTPTETQPPAPVETDAPAPVAEIVDQSVTVSRGGFEVAKACFVNNSELTYQPTGNNEIFGGSNRGTEQPTNDDLVAPITMTNQNPSSPIFRTATVDDYNSETGFAFFFVLKGSFGDIKIQYNDRITTAGRHQPEAFVDPNNPACWLKLGFVIETAPLA